jgi:hypothetical protein
MPPQVGARPSDSGCLPPGIAMVGFDCDHVPAGAKIVEPGLHLLRGVTGELIELFTDRN